MQERNQETKVIFHLLYFVLVFFARALACLLLFVLVIRGCSASYHFCYEIFGSVSVDTAPGTEKEFKVHQSDTMSQVAKRLSEKGLIAGRYTFYIRTELMNPNQVELRPGTYRLTTSMDYDAIINELTTSD